MVERPDELEAKTIFLAAIQLDGADRAAFVHGACTNEPIRQRVERLLAGHREKETRQSPTSIREFRIIRELGRGGMGVVHLAEDLVLGRTVALKTLADWVTGDTSSVARFFHEAQAAAQLNSPHIVQIYQFGEESGCHFIAMEYVEGRSLAQELADPSANDLPTDSASFRRIATIVAEIATALDAAHTHDPPVVHRDVKPSNILIDPDGRAKLADFGIAKMLAERVLTLDGHTPGTPQYMSPEQALAHAVDHRSDIYSLGVVLYEQIARRRPFLGDTAAAMVESLRTGEAPALSGLNSRVPADLATICHKAIEKLPADRYQSALQFAAELRSFARGDPILTRPPGVRRRISRWAWRHRRSLLVAWAALSPALLVMVVAIARSSWRSSRVLLIVEPTGATGVVTVSRLSDETLEYGAAQPLGTSPTSRYLPAGCYRIAVVAGGARVAEVDVRLDPAQVRELQLSPPLLADADVTRGMVRVPAGTHVFGRADGAPFEAMRSVTLPEFYIDACEVSNADYKRYVDATNAPTPALWSALGGYNAALADRPIVGLTIEEMGAYAVWAGKRLPTALEWDAAARYPDGRRHPWTGDPPPEMPEPTREDLIADRTADDAEWVRLYRERSQPVASAPQLRSVLGLYHTFGNVSEATSTFVAAYGANVVKGGTLLDTPRTWALDRSGIAPPGAKSLSVGFRCARSTFSALVREVAP